MSDHKYFIKSRDTVSLKTSAVWSDLASKWVRLALNGTNLVSQNVLKSDLKHSQICLIWDHVVCQIWSPTGLFDTKWDNPKWNWKLSLKSPNLSILWSIRPNLRQILTPVLWTQIICYSFGQTLKHSKGVRCWRNEARMSQNGLEDKSITFQDPLDPKYTKKTTFFYN